MILSILRRFRCLYEYTLAIVSAERFDLHWESFIQVQRGVTCQCLCNIPDGIVAITDSAFRFCFNLTAITIPNSVTRIGYAAFSNCYAAQRVDIFK